MPLHSHLFRTGKPELNARVSMYRVVDTAVVRAEAAEQCTVRGINDRIAFQCGDIPMPQINIVHNGCKTGNVGHTLFLRFPAQIFILYMQKFLIAGLWRSHIEQRAEQAFFCLLLLRRGELPPGFRTKPPDKIKPSFALCHIIHRRTPRSFQGNSARNTAGNARKPPP